MCVSPEREMHEPCSPLGFGLAETDWIDWWVGPGTGREGPQVSSSHEQEEPDVFNWPSRKLVEEGE